MIKKLRILLLSVVLLPGILSAQLLDKKTTYSRKDSLQGTLSPYRSCYDVTFYDLQVKVDIANQFIKGANTIYYNATADFTTLQVDLFSELKVTGIMMNGMPLAFEREFNAVFIHFPKIRKGATGSFTVAYEGNPHIAKNPPWDGGFSFEKDKKNNDLVGVSCQGLGASVWWPDKDHLSDEPDSMRIRAIVPDRYTCVANGNLQKETPVSPGWREFDWFISYPVNNYNVTLNIGNYVHFSDSLQEGDGRYLRLDYYVLDYNLEKAKKQFQQVKPMLTCYEKYLGPYPFHNDGYALVETSYLGMEHQGAIAYGNGYKTGYLGFDYSGIGLNFDYIIIHETAHEWWGNNVSMKDLADMWIHEGFATYSESMYVECIYGPEKALAYINAMKNNVSNDAPIIGDYNVNNEGSGDMYAKSAIFLHTLRTLTDNDSLWWSIIRGIQDTFAKQTISTADIENYISRKAGKDFSKEFDQFLRHTNLPVFEYSLRPMESGFAITYRWKSDVQDFNMPLRYSDGINDAVWIYPTTDWQTLEIKGADAGRFKLDEQHFYFVARAVKSQ